MNSIVRDKTNYPWNNLSLLEDENTRVRLLVVAQNSTPTGIWGIKIEKGIVLSIGIAKEICGLLRLN